MLHLNACAVLVVRVRAIGFAPLSEQSLSGLLALEEEEDLPMNRFRTLAHRIGARQAISSFRPRMIQDLTPSRN